MVHASILTAEFTEGAARATWNARQAALASGQSVVYVDGEGRLVEEFPDGRLFEIRLDPSRPRDARRVVLRELRSHAA